MLLTARVEAGLDRHDRDDQQGIEAMLLGRLLGRHQGRLDHVPRHPIGIGDPVAHPKHLG